jgi:hypothetical protein
MLCITEGGETHVGEGGILCAAVAAGIVATQPKLRLHCPENRQEYHNTIVFHEMINAGNI